MLHFFRKWNFEQKAMFIGGVVFLFWMLLLDNNSYVFHRWIDKEIKSLEKQKEFLQREIAKDRAAYKLITTPEGKEQYAREHYYLKADNEDIFLIEFDTIPAGK